MRKPVRSRRLIALLAAYLVALQTLLLPLTVAAGAAFDGSICTASATFDGAQPPAGHDSTCPCAAGCGMQCCAQALAAPPRIEHVLGPARIGVIAAPPSIEAVIRPSSRSPQLARAPPAA